MERRQAHFYCQCEFILTNGPTRNLSASPAPGAQFPLKSVFRDVLQVQLPLFPKPRMNYKKLTGKIRLVNVGLCYQCLYCVTLHSTRALGRPSLELLLSVSMQHVGRKSHVITVGVAGTRHVHNGADCPILRHGVLH